MTTFVPRQIIPAAPGTRALFYDEDASDWISDPVVAWALCEDTEHKGWTAVHGFAVDTEGVFDVEDASNFERYVLPGEELPDFAEAKAERRAGVRRVS